MEQTRYFRVDFPCAKIPMVSMLAMRGELFAVIARLMSKCL